MLELLLPGDENMRRDRELLAAAEQGMVGWRVYTWDGIWVSLGRNQKPEEVLLDPESTQWVSRPTGGSAVLHGHDVTVSIAMPMPLVQELNRHLDLTAKEPIVWAVVDDNGHVVGEQVSPAGTRLIMSRSIDATYRAVTTPLVQALNACGIAAALAEDVGKESEYAMLPDCFASTTRNDVIDPRTLAKVCGCALHRTRHGALLQASIPAGEPLVEPSQVIVGGVRTAISRIEAASLADALRSALPG